ncbi:MAG: ABC transporter substrate-binding protein [Peptostreptococcaceae bacterium]
MKKILKSIISSFMILMLVAPTVFADNNSKLVIGVHKDENNITPYTYITGAPGLDLVNLVYDKLFILDKDNNVIPWMVEEDYKVSEDFKTFEFKLVANQKWHDDNPLTAEDIKFALEYAKEQKNAKARIIDSVEVKDELSFVITLSESNMDFISDGLTNIFMVPKHVHEKYEKAEEVKETIGSGIYKLKEYKVGEYYKFEANEEYFKGAVNPKEIYMPIITDSTAMFQAIKSGEIATTTMGLSPELLETFSSDENIEILNSPGFATTLFQFNTERELLKNSNVRNAISKAINIDEIIETVMLGYSQKGNPGFFSKELNYANKDLEFKYNVDEAKKMLEKEGYKLNKDNVLENDKGEKLSFELLVYSSSASRIRMAEMIKEDLKQVGIEIKITSLDATTVDELVWPGFDVAQGRDFDMSMWGWSAGTQLSQTNVVGLGHSDTSKGNFNIGGYNNPEFDKLADEFSATLDVEKRKELMSKLQEILGQDVPFVTLLNQDVINVYNKNFGDNWIMQKGYGLINRFSFLNEESNVGAKSDSNKTIYVGLGVLALAGVGAAVYFNKKKRG